MMKIEELDSFYFSGIKNGECTISILKCIEDEENIFFRLKISNSNFNAGAVCENTTTINFYDLNNLKKISEVFISAFGKMKLPAFI